LIGAPRRSSNENTYAIEGLFWGHDGVMEASSYVNEDALKRIQPSMRPDKAGILAAFDLHRDLIHMTAAKVYRRGRKGSYELIPADF
jgi:Protein of unknown function (DUF1488)